MHLKEYFILSFETTSAVIQAEKHIKDTCPIAIMPTPHEISAGCGLSIRFLDSDETKIIGYCRSLPFSGTLYKLSTSKKGNKRPLTKLLTF